MRHFPVSRARVVSSRRALPSWQLRAPIAGLIVCLIASCATPSREKRVLAYSPDDFRSELLQRIPNLPDRLIAPPHVVDAETVERARTHVMRAKSGPDRVQALVDFLSLEKPDGLGLAYDWSSTGSAAATIELGRGNCVALASVLIALGRGLEWPIYYAEARTRKPETHEFQAMRALSDHMAVILATKSFQMVIDFTGLLDEVEDIRPIDDLTAYAHILNNTTAQRLMMPGINPSEAQWDAAIQGFELATRIQPSLGRAWNNLGIALTRRRRFEEARAAYERAVALDTAFGSAEVNLTIMETRALGEATILRSDAEIGEN